VVFNICHLMRRSRLRVGDIHVRDRQPPNDDGFHFSISVVILSVRCWYGQFLMMTTERLRPVTFWPLLFFWFGKIPIIAIIVFDIRRSTSLLPTIGPTWVPRFRAGRTARRSGATQFSFVFDVGPRMTVRRIITTCGMPSAHFVIGCVCNPSPATNSVVFSLVWRQVLAMWVVDRVMAPIKPIRIVTWIHSE
jgi:hypothetical protein